MTERELIDALGRSGTDYRPKKNWEQKVWSRVRLGQASSVPDASRAAGWPLALLAAASLILVGFTAHRFLSADEENRKAAVEALHSIEEEIKMVQADIAVYRREMQAAYRDLEEARSEEERFRALARRKRAEIEEARAFAELTGLRKKSRETSLHLSGIEKQK